MLRADRTSTARPAEVKARHVNSSVDPYPWRGVITVFPDVTGVIMASEVTHSVHLEEGK